MTSDARAIRLIRDHLRTQWPLPDVPLLVDPEPQGDTCAHVEVWTGTRRASRLGWIHVRCWVPVENPVASTERLHLAARGIFEETRIAGDDGVMQVEQGERMDIGRDGPWWMSVVSFPFRFVAM